MLLSACIRTKVAEADKDNVSQTSITSFQIPNGEYVPTNEEGGFLSLHDGKFELSLSDFTDSHIEGSYKTTSDLLILTTSAGETFVFKIKDMLICLDLSLSTASLPLMAVENGFHDGIELRRSEPEGDIFALEGVYETQGELKSILKLEEKEFEWTFSSPEETVLNGSYVVDNNEGRLYLFLENAENYCFRIIEDGTYRLELDLSIGWMPGIIYHVPKSMDKMVFIQQGQQN